MERSVKRKLSTLGSDSGGIGEEASNRMYMKVDLNGLPWDPSERNNISDYPPEHRDAIRRQYLMRGPCQPRTYNFPRKTVGNKGRRFCPAWFDQYGWLEYSIKADKAFCLPCYLFRDELGKQGRSHAFVTEGFYSWNKSERLALHVGDVNSFHNKALKKCEELMSKRQDQSIVVAAQKQRDIVNFEHRVQLNASVDAARYLLNCAIPFHGYEVLGNSHYKGNFLETVKEIQNHDEIVREVTLQNDADSNHMVSPSIQKAIVNCFAQEILKSIFEEIGDDVFALLVDEFDGVSKKKQVAVVLRYITCGIVKERFVGLVHVTEADAVSLKTAIESLFDEYGLSLDKVRGQGYNGASNMHDEFSDLKALIMGENCSAYYVHCFAHQLQLVVETVAKKHINVGKFFAMVDILRNVVCASCKHKDTIKESLKEKVQEAIGVDEIETEDGINQKLSLVRDGDTLSGSRYKTLMHLVDLFPDVVEVLEYIEDEGYDSFSQYQAHILQIYFQSFDFVFYLHLMLHILGVTDLLSRTLQRKDQEIVNTVSLVKSTKRELRKFKVEGFSSLMTKISLFCGKHDLEMLNMDEDYVNPKNQRQKTNITYLHHYEFDCFNRVVDMQVQELGDRFSEVSSELLICMGALSPCDLFSHFDTLKLLKLVELYKHDFSSVEIMTLEHELHLYLDNVLQDKRFTNLKGVSDLARVMVETRKHLIFPLVYRLLKLVLVLPVVTATVERCVFAMKHETLDLRHENRDDFLNAGVISAVEREALAKVTNEDVMKRLEKMKIGMELL